MTEQYQKRDINNGQNFGSNQFAPGDSPFELSVQTQLASFDTANAAGTVQLPAANSTGPNAEIVIVALNASVNPLTLALSGMDQAIFSSCIQWPDITEDNVVTTLRSNGVDSWIVTAQTTCVPGPTGPAGPTGPTGPTGPAGP